jgi:hypothetical protein
MNKSTLIIFVVSLLLAGCNGASQPPQSNEVLKPSANSAGNGKNVSVRGKVTQIQRGKDGYTAEIKTDDGAIFSAVISSVNLASQYREVKVGDAIAVEGEDLFGDGKTIKVTGFK